MQEKKDSLGSAGKVAPACRGQSTKHRSRTAISGMTDPREMAVSTGLRQWKIAGPLDRSQEKLARRVPVLTLSMPRSQRHHDTDG